MFSKQTIPSLYFINYFIIQKQLVCVRVCVCVGEGERVYVYVFVSFAYSLRT